MTEHVLPPIKVAFILDNEVVDVLHTDERLGAILLSNPLIMDITKEDGTQNAFVGDKYNPETNEFTTARVIDSADDESAQA